MTAFRLIRDPEKSQFDHLVDADGVPVFQEFVLGLPGERCCIVEATSLFAALEGAADGYGLLPSEIGLSP